MLIKSNQTRPDEGFMATSQAREAIHNTPRMVRAKDTLRFTRLLVFITTTPFTPANILTPVNLYNETIPYR